jgi:hypothetical protein
MASQVPDKKPAGFNSVLWWVGIILLSGFALTMASVIIVAYLNGEYAGGKPDYKGSGSPGGLAFGLICCGGFPFLTSAVLYFMMKKQKAANQLQLQQYLEHKIFYFARSQNGQVTITEIVMELGISADEAKKLMDNLVVKGFCEMQIAESGTIVYKFNDLSSAKDTAQPVV